MKSRYVRVYIGAMLVGVLGIALIPSFVSIKWILFGCSLSWMGLSTFLFCRLAIRLLEEE